MRLVQPLAPDETVPEYGNLAVAPLLNVLLKQLVVLVAAVERSVAPEVLGVHVQRPDATRMTELSGPQRLFHARSEGQRVRSAWVEPLVVFKDVSNDPSPNLFVALQWPPRLSCVVLRQGQVHTPLDQLPRVQLAGGEPGGKAEDTLVLQVSRAGRDDQFIADIADPKGSRGHSHDLGAALLVVVNQVGGPAGCLLVYLVN